MNDDFTIGGSDFEMSSVKTKTLDIVLLGGVVVEKWELFICL